MISAHLPATEINHIPVFCQHQQPFAPGVLKRSLQRPRRCHKKFGSTCASSHPPSETCVDLPESSTRLPSRSIRKQLEYLYQLEHPQLLLWPSFQIDQHLASDSRKRQQSLAVQLCESPPKSSELKDPDSTSKRDDYYANVGSAIRTLRDETPFLFQQDLSCKHAVLCLLQFMLLRLLLHC